MADKQMLIKQFQLQPDKYWKVSLFDKGWKRKHCKNCGKWFWTLTDQDVCNDSSCRGYEFIGKKFTKKSFDYFSAWKAIEKFFKDNEHTPLKRYPTVCRWYPLYFTIAGIVDFYRMSGNKLTFEFPANPSILLQPCLRFNDIPNVGINGRSCTSFGMIQQSALYDGKNGYWKDECIDLDYRLLTEVYGIKPEAINFIEDVWVGHGAFGYSLEYHVAGLELGNAVFTEFAGTPDKFSTMKNKVIDMGAGLERFAWLSKGSPTAYDAVYGPVLDKIRIKSGYDYDFEFFTRYSYLSGCLNLDENANIEASRANIAEKLSVSKDMLQKKIEPMQALYAIADHAKTLCFALSDNGIPSNVGGGYNLRVVLRRALSFIDKYGFDFDLMWVADKMAKYFKPIHPELLENIDRINEIFETEEKKYKGTIERSRQIIETVLKRNQLTENKMIELYDSHGITPEIISEVAAKNNIKVNFPADFYAKVTERHMHETAEAKETPNFPATKNLFYDNDKLYEFTAKVVKIIGNKIILDQSAFYPRGGGQEPDKGTIAGNSVYDVEKLGEAVLHYIENPTLKEGQTVKCKIDAKRREQLAIHHTTTHIINAAAQKVLGPHVWQEGSKKDVDKAHLDLTHYKSLDEKDVDKIEKRANEIVKMNLRVGKRMMPRTEAEKKFGFRIYQGAAVPFETLRIISIGGIEHEACGGIHVNNTKEIGQIIITKVEKPQDGIIRFIYSSGPAAEKQLKWAGMLLFESAKLLKTKEENVPKACAKLLEEWKKSKKDFERYNEKMAQKSIKEIKFKEENGLKILIKDIPNASLDQLKELSKELTKDNTVIILFGIADKINVFGSAGPLAVKAGVNIGNIVRSICQQLGGNGGGSPMLAQGTGTDKKKIKDAMKVKII